MNYNLFWFDIKEKHIIQISCPCFVFIFVLIAFETLQSEMIDEYFENFLNIVHHSRTYRRSCWFCSHKYDFYCGALAAFCLYSLARSQLSFSILLPKSEIDKFPMRFCCWFVFAAAAAAAVISLLLLFFLFLLLLLLLLLFRFLCLLCFHNFALASGFIYGDMDSRIVCTYNLCSLGRF